MLTLTDTAVQVIRDLSSQGADSGDTGVRISSRTDSAGSLALSVVEGPEPSDQVIEAAGARVFLDPTAANVLDDKSLDADVDDQGSVAFLIVEQGV